MGTETQAAVSHRRKTAHSCKGLRARERASSQRRGMRRQLSGQEGAGGRAGGGGLTRPGGHPLPRTGASLQEMRAAGREGGAARLWRGRRGLWHPYSPQLLPVSLPGRLPPHPTKAGGLTQHGTHAQLGPYQAAWARHSHREQGCTLWQLSAESK